MKSLTVMLDYSAIGYSSGALPVRVLDTEGGLVAEGVASSSHPAVISVPDTDDAMFVRLTWPSGKAQTKKVGSDPVVRFGDERSSRNEWSAWAVPRLNERTPLAEPERASTETSIDRYNRA